MMKIVEKERVGTCSLVHNILKVKRHVRAPGWGLKRMKNGSIIHMDLHKPNNKLVNA